MKTAKISQNHLKPTKTTQNSPTPPKTSESHPKPSKTICHWVMKDFKEQKRAKILDNTIFTKLQAGKITKIHIVFPFR